MAATSGSSVPLEREQPLSFDPASRPRKRDAPSGRRIKRSPSSKQRNRSPSQASAGSEDASYKSRMLLKYLLSKAAIYTAANCSLCLPAQFFRKNKVDQYVTMTDSAGLQMWHMRFQSSGFFGHRRHYRIGNGWREFSYQHSLKLNDALLFTLVSSSHFVVEFVTSDGSIRAMHPTREGKDYPWPHSNHRLDCLTSLQLQALQENQIQKKAQEAEKIQIREEAQDGKQEHIRKKIQVVNDRRVPQNVTTVISPNTQDQAFSQCNTVRHGKRITTRSRKEYVSFPEFKYLECTNPDGSQYLQILDSDCDTSGEDED